MANDGSNNYYLQILYVGFVWGCTNPLLRKGTKEAEAEEREREERLVCDDCSISQIPAEGAVQCNRYEGDNESPKNVSMSPLTKHINETMCLQETLPLSAEFSYGSTSRSVNSSMRSDDISFDESLQFPSSSMGNVSIGNDSYEQNCHKEEAKFCFDNKILDELENAGEATSKKKKQKTAFFTGIFKTLMAFRRPSVLIPFLLNQSSAYQYYKLLALSGITNIAYCNALAMVFSAFTSYLLGERMSNPCRGFVGAVLVMLGVSICIRSKNIEDFIGNHMNTHHRDMYSYYNSSIDNNSIMEENEEFPISFSKDLRWQLPEHGMITTSPFVCWYAFAIANHLYVVLDRDD
mmetsp:Transcript_9285/g.11730  ORF Transcript_9285/g.11730 Transcript_9285/m.11730 type:complete len:349 (+) Transcript_9285:116-1162(+)